MAIYRVYQTYEGALRQYSFNGNLHDTSAAATADPTQTGTINFEQGGTNGYAYFNSGSRLTCPEFVSSGTTGGDFTISLWYFPAQASGTGNTVFYIGNLLLYFLSNNKIGGSHWNDYFTREGTNTYPRNTWHHIVVVGRGTTLTYYVDTVQEYTRSNIGTVGIGGGTWYINTSPRTNDNPAAYDEFIVDNVAWSETQILSYYNATAPVHQLVDNPGVYWNPSQGLISVSNNGTNRMTMADKNLGATHVFGESGATKENQTGYLYQWGNCYAFSNDSTATITINSNVVDVTNYGPSNYYNSSTFVTQQIWFTPWSTTSNLWGDATNTNEARQGPCPSGRHVMSVTDGGILESLGYTTSGDVLRNALKMSFDWYSRNYSTGAIGNSNSLWLSSDFRPGHSVSYASASSTGNTYFQASGRGTVPGQAFPIRPVKNTPVRPDASRRVLYQPSS